MNSIPQKRCYKCKQQHPLTFFYGNGTASACKKCAKEIQAERRIAAASSDIKEKRCSACKDTKKISEFHAGHAYCKKCQNDYARTRSKKEEIYEKERIPRRKAQLKRKYNMTLEEYDEMFVRQFGLCAICGQAPNNGKLYVDHCHVSGLVRKLLCGNCNSLLGFSQDNPDILRKAIAYLKSMEDECPIESKDVPYSQ